MTGLVILLKLGSFLFIFGPYDLEITWINLKNNRVPPPWFIKLCPLFQSHEWIKTGGIVRKCSIRVKIGNWTNWNLTDDLENNRVPVCATSSFARYFVDIGQFKLVTVRGENWRFFVLCDLQIWWMALKNNRESFLYCLKLCVSLHNHRWIQTRVTV